MGATGAALPLAGLAEGGQSARVRFSRMVAPVLVMLLCATAPSVCDALTGTELARALEGGFVEVFEKVAPSVVIVEAERPGEARAEDELGFFFRDGGPPGWAPESERSEGSGFVVREDGLVMTNLHVVKGAKSIRVKLKDGRSFPATLFAGDDKTDVALLKTEAAGLKPVEFGDSDAVRVGQFVCAIGVPFNLDFSFTCGWVSGKGRSRLTELFYEDYIQTDAFINPGNSGGPLFDIEGRVIGMNTLINGIGRGLAFAIPSNLLREVSAQLVAHGRIVRPWLGLRVEEIERSGGLREHLVGAKTGVVVLNIVAGAPAYDSDLRVADVIVSVDGVRVSKAIDLQREIAKKQVGQAVKLAVWRAGKDLEIEVVPAVMPSETASSRDAPDAAQRATGLTLRDAEGGGAEVAAVEPGSLAERAGVMAGDRITDIERRPVADAAAAREMLGRAGSGTLLLILREGQKTFAVLGTAE